MSALGRLYHATLPPSIVPRTTNPNGIVIFDASGGYALTLAGRGRSKFNIPNPPPSVREVRLQAKPEEYKAAAMGFAANFGTWSFNEANKTLTLHYDGALFPNVEGEEVTATVTKFLRR